MLGVFSGVQRFRFNEDVLCWDIKKGELLSRWRDENCNSQVTAIAQSRTDKDVFAVGYDDGSIRLWDSRIAEPVASVREELAAAGLRTHANVEELLAAGGADAALIAAPTDLHVELVAELAAAGLPILCEKPCGLRPV